MPIDPVTGVLIGTAISSGVSGAQAIAQGKLNRKNRKFQQHMYNIQRQDNLSNWHMQNTYNSPQEQMKRLQEAGLNPNLIYGSGGGQTQAGSVDAASFGNPSTQVPDLSGIANAPAQGLNQIYDLTMKQAQTDNLKEQNDLLVIEQELKKILAKKSMTEEERARFDLNLERSLLQNSIAFRKGMTKKQLAEIGLIEEQTATEGKRGALTYWQSVGEQKRVKEGGLLDQQTEKERLDNQLRVWGLQPTDHVNYRLIARALSERGGIIDLKMVSQLLAAGMVEFITN